MDPFIVNPRMLKNILVRLLSFSVLILAIRFAYIITISGESCNSGNFCFFPEKLKLRDTATTTTRIHSSSAAAAAGSGDLCLTDLWTSAKFRNTVVYYSSIFQDLIADGFLSPNSKSLCLETLTGEDVFALKEIGVFDSIGISKKPLRPLIISGQPHHQPFSNNTFDFVFSGNGGLDRSSRPIDFASEISRTLKPGGFFVSHINAKDEYSLNSFLDLFNCCRFIRSRDIEGVDSSSKSIPSIREIVMKKEVRVSRILDQENWGKTSNGILVNTCSIPGYKREIVTKLEPLIEQEPLKPWLSLKRKMKNMKYLTSMVDISFKQRYVYIDIGARNYGSSIGNWFKKHYPKQNKTFEIFAIEADKSFHEDYMSKKGVTLLPYAAWIRNETLFFEITRDPSFQTRENGRGMGRIQPVKSSTSYMGDKDKIEGFDVANWLKNTVSERDFVVVKMDVEGSEFHLIPWLVETGAICLVDEMFVECHYNRWQRCCHGKRSVKHQKNYGQCLELFTSLREKGILVHQWWW